MAELIWASVSWQWSRGYVYLGSQLLAVQQSGVNWVHEDPVTKSKRVTNSSGTVVSTIELDPWGANTGRSINSSFQPRRFTSYTNDSDGGDDAMMRRYGSSWSRFSQPDPSDGSYDSTNPQSFNRYAYVHGDPVNFIDPKGLLESWNCSAQYSSCAGTGGGGYSGTPFDSGSYFMGGYADLPGNIAGALAAFDQRVQNTRDGLAAAAGLSNRNFAAVIAILNRNENVGVSVGNLMLWGGIAAEFIRGYGAPIDIAGLQFPFPIDPEAIAIKNGLNAAVRLMKQLRAPDFYFVSLGGGAQVSPFITRHGNFMVQLGGSPSIEVAVFGGWILQWRTPNKDQLYQFLGGWSAQLDVFLNPWTKTGFGLGLGVIRSPRAEGVSRTAAIIGLGGGGGVSWGYGGSYPDWLSFTENWYRRLRR